MLAKLMSFLLLGIVRFLTGSQARWYGCPPKAEQRIYFANHSSHGDFVLFWASLPPHLRQRTRPVAGADYWLTGRLRRFLIQRVSTDCRRRAANSWRGCSSTPVRSPR